ncbi:carboxylating nicotinate-nucleotide diphosphorylase [Syntrophomonas palmitatica]|uniref:carboxylating nicotinate-nucleotide diphosphorylase n=1 Tax=Syntrophomonas palmitatica TaxID=402877 RepID=UPI0006D0B062|nr:carboxylating nicotinate-nucleotide diphosphorylase [Syntrophomonas palmitatica]
MWDGLEELINRALLEDIGHGDVTTLSLVAPEKKAAGVFRAKASGILAGIEISRAVFRQLDPQTEFIIYKRDGEKLLPGDIIARAEGLARVLLTGERLALNFVQHLSGIATRTRRMAELIQDCPARLVDTRKTVPGMRVLQKYAVTVGGGQNHRFGLYDGVMIKDNHIEVAGGITNAVARARAGVPHTLKIEVEVESLTQLEEALQAGADIIMLDNMDLATMKKAVEIAQGRVLLEASGGINEDTIADIARTGVDLISCGLLTHSVNSLDISFDITSE